MQELHARAIGPMNPLAVMMMMVMLPPEATRSEDERRTRRKAAAAAAAKLGRLSAPRAEELTVS